MRRRVTFSRKHLLGVVLGFSVVASLVGPRIARPLRQAAGFLLAPLGDGPMYAVTKLTARLPDDAAGRMSAEEARRLRQENEYLRRLVTIWRSESERHERHARMLANFQRMYGPTQELACELISGRVVGAGSLPYGRSRVVRPSGSRAVREGAAVTTRQVLTDRSKALPPRLAVVNDVALVGRITETGAFTARLQLVTDSGFQVHARIRRVISSSATRMITVTEGDLPSTTTLTPANNRPIDVIARGDGARRLIVEHVKGYHNVLPGDLLVTSTREEDLPVEIHIGKVVEVRRDAKAPHRVTLSVEPHADLDGLRDVLILSPLSPPPGQAPGD
jgi:cell shape-determining protein MreC